MTKGGALARRYARALFGLGQERGDVGALLAEVDTLVDVAVGSDALQRVLFTPIHPRSERRGVVRELAERLGLSTDVRSFALLLVDANRTSSLPEIRDALRVLVEQAAGRVDGRLVSARPLRDDEVQKLRAALSRRVGAEVHLDLEVDTRLIGGVIAHVGDLMIDGSVRTQVDSLAENLRRGSA